jgi:hypothetical protein
MFITFLLIIAQFAHLGSAGWGVITEYANNICQGEPVAVKGLVLDVCVGFTKYSCENGKKKNKFSILPSECFFYLFIFRLGIIYSTGYNNYECSGADTYTTRIQEATYTNGGDCSHYGSLQSRKLSCVSSPSPPMPSSFSMLVKYDDGECNNPVQFTALPDGKCSTDQYSSIGLKFVYPVVNSYNSYPQLTCSASSLEDFRDYTTCTPLYGGYGMRYGRMYHAGTAIVTNTRSPSRSPTAAPTGGQLYTVEGDIVLSNIDYNSLSEIQKGYIMTATGQFLGYPYFIQVVITETNPVTARRNLLSSSSSLRNEEVHPETTTPAINLHFNFLATDLVLIGRPSTAAEITQVFKNRVDNSFISYFRGYYAAYFTAPEPQYQSSSVSALIYISPSYAPTSAPPTQSPTALPTPTPSFAPTGTPTAPSLSSSSSSSSNKKSSSNMVVIIVPVVVGSVFLIVLIFGAIYLSSCKQAETSPVGNNTAAAGAGQPVGNYAPVVAVDSSTAVATSVNVETI